MNEPRFDVAVLGGGPAGSAAAIELARRRRSVVLLEREARAPQRLCGEFLSPAGVRTLQSLGAIGAVEAFGPAPIGQWSVAAGDAEIGGSLPGAALGVSRRALDPALRRVAARAGAELREGERVRSVEVVPGDGWRVLSASGSVVAARWIILATGRRARPAGLGSEHGPRPGTDVAMKAHFAASRADSRVQLFALPGAYVGLSPVEGGLVNVCFLARRVAFRRAGSDPRSLLEEGARRNAAFARAWSGMEIAGEWVAAAGMSFRPRGPRSLSGAMACGDAAAEVAPFLGAGMATALAGGSLAGRHADRALSLGRLGAPRYRRDWGRAFRPRLRIGRALQPVLLFPPAAAAAVRALRPVPGLARALVERVCA